MENYIIYIYRRDLCDPERLDGLPESVERETQHPFHTLKELRALLVPANKPDQPAGAESESNS
jgi:hypothetical protein